MNGLNEAGKHFLGVKEDFESQHIELNLRQLKYAVAEMLDQHDPNYPHNDADQCSDCDRVRDEHGRVYHAVNCVFDTMGKFLKNPKDFGFNK